MNGSTIVRRGLSGSALKIIACLSMLIDHFAAAFEASMPETLYWCLRILGRPAFIIFCFLICEGFRRTGCLWKYMLRLSIFALISEVPFDLLFSGQVWDFSHQNVFFTLLLGLGAIACYEKFRSSGGMNIGVVFVVLFALVAHYLNTDYGAIGVMAIFIIYAFDRFPVPKYILLALVLLSTGIESGSLLNGLVELPAITGLLLCECYNGSRGINLKYAFYAFYPGHILLLWLTSGALYGRF